MPTKVKSTQVQQNFGLMMDRVLTAEDIIVERYGLPRVAIVEYHRYQRFVKAERGLLCAPDCNRRQGVSARAAHMSDDEVESLIERARSAAHEEA